MIKSRLFLLRTEAAGKQSIVVATDQFPDRTICIRVCIINMFLANGVNMASKKKKVRRKIRKRTPLRDRSVFRLRRTDSRIKTSRV